MAATTLAPLSQAGRLRCLQHLVKHCADLWEGARHKTDEARQVSHFPRRGWCLGLPDQRNPVGGWERVRWREGPLQKPTGKIQFGAWRNCRQPVGLRNRKSLPQAARWTTKNFLCFLVSPPSLLPFFLQCLLFLRHRARPVFHSSPLLILPPLPLHPLLNGRPTPTGPVQTRPFSLPPLSS